MSNSLQPHESQHARPPCPSPTPRIYSNSRPSSQWCHPAISSSVIPFSSCPQSLPATESSNESALRMRWPKYWSFSFSIRVTLKNMQSFNEIAFLSTSGLSSSAAALAPIKIYWSGTRTALGTWKTALVAGRTLMSVWSGGEGKYEGLAMTLTPDASFCRILLSGQQSRLSGQC